MVLISLVKYSQNFSLKIVGHAAYNVGNDIVCSGVSAITETLLICLQEEGISYKAKEPGKVIVEGVLNDKVNNYLHFAYVGFKGISITYPDNVDVKLKIVQDDDSFNIKHGSQTTAEKE